MADARSSDALRSADGAEALVDLREGPLSVDAVIASVSRTSAGAVAIFVGVVRDENEGKKVTRLDYSAYASMAKREMRAIVAEVEADFSGSKVAVLHRLGTLMVGDAAVVCAASAPHRDEAFRACRATIDRIKARVPIWKREWGEDGAAWVGWVDARCSPDENGHGHAHAGHDHRGSSSDGS